jgi:hypothetical protein
LANAAFRKECRRSGPHGFEESTGGLRMMGRFLVGICMDMWSFNDVRVS